MKVKKNNSGWWGLLVILALLSLYEGEGSSNSGFKNETVSTNTVSATISPTKIMNTPTPIIINNSYSPSYFYDYECTDDCSGHEAGYEWASDNDIDSTDDCGGNSQSFIEGCQSYVEEMYGEYSEEYEW